MAFLAAAIISPLLALLTGCSKTPQEREAMYMKRGNAYLAARDFRKAEIEFKVASQNMPKDAEPIYMLGMTYLSGGANKMAAEEFQKATTLNPKHEAARYQLALFKVGTSKPEFLEDAERTISDWTANHPNDANAIAALGLVDAKLGRKAEALDRFAKAGAKDRSTLRVASAAVAVYAARGDGDAVKELARQLAEKLPQSPEAAVLHAEVELAAHDTAGADAEVARALSLKNDFRPALQLRLRRLRAGGDTQQAEQTTIALSRLPDRDLWGAYGRQLFIEKKVDEGIAEFGRALKAHNDDVSLRDDYAAALLEADRRAEAEAVANATLKKNPQDVPALMLRAILEIDRVSLDAAARDVRKLKELGFASAQLKYQESRIFAARGETVREGDLLTEALQRDSTLLAARLQLARILTTSGKGKGALAILDEAPAAQKRIAEFAMNRNIALMAAGSWDEARRAVDAALAVSRDPAFLYQDAVLRVRSKDLAGARKSLEEAFRTAPSDRATLRLLGGIMQQQGEYPKFLEMVRDAAARHRESASLQDALGSLLERQGDKAGARAAFETAKAAGDSAGSEIEIALLDFRTGEVEKARDRLLNLVKAHDSVAARTALADIEMRPGSGDGPVREYLQALKMEPSNALIMNNLAAYLASRQKKYDDAIFWGQKALALAPKSPIIEDTIGWTYYLQGKYDEAEPFLENSAKTASRPVAHYHLAAVLAKVGDMARGRKEYELAVKQDPQSPERVFVEPLYGK